MPSEPPARLRGWDEIAAYLRVDKKTAQRYAKSKGLPVIRPVGRHGTVVADPDELEAWLRHGQLNEAEAGGTTEGGSSVGPQIPFSPDVVPLPHAGSEVLPKSEMEQSQHLKVLMTPVALGGFYATLYVLALFLEIAYRYDDLGPRARQFAPYVWIWIGLCAILGIFLDWFLTSRGRVGGLGWSMAINIAGVLVLCGALWRFLPSTSVTEITLQPQTAQAAFLKDVLLYFLPLAVVFWLIPFHSISTLHREARSGNIDLILDIMAPTGRPLAPAGFIFIRVSWLAFALFGTGLFTIASTNYLFDHLRPGPFMNLFMQVALAKIFVYFLFGLLCLLWYARALNQLKGACMRDLKQAAVTDS